MPADVGDALARFEEGISALDLAARQERYAEAFDFDPDCTLDLGWHLFGDSHERGAFMAALADDLARAGVVRSAELPDHLSHVLALIGREEPQRAGMLTELIEPAVQQVRRSLASRRSPYGALIDAVCAALEAVRGRDRSARR
jgi:nitrate reductase delta subunit